MKKKEPIKFIDKPIEEKIATFQKISQEIVASNEGAYRYPISSYHSSPHINYTKEEALQIIQDGNSEELRQLSVSFFYSSGFYRRMNLYYATLLTYSFLVIPSTKENKMTSQIQNKYNEALDILEDLNPQNLCIQIALKVFAEGAFYGILSTNSEGKQTIINLPFDYCRSRYKTYDNIDIVEFNLRYFDKIANKEQRIACLKTYPDSIRIAYNAFKNKGMNNWYQIPAENGIHFNLYEDRPFLADIIPAVIDFNEYREIEKTKDKQELQKIITQEMPHLNDGELVFEPEEVLEMHKGVVQMLKNSKGVDVLTSFGDVDVKDLQGARGVITNNLEKIEKSIYSEAGVSKQLFSADTTTSLNKSLDNDCALAMILGNLFANWFKFIINSKCASYQKLSFDVVILPITYFNRLDMFKNSLNAAQNGYSFIIPSLCLGISQKQLVNLKKLEKSLNLSELMEPLQSSYTQSKEKAGSKEEGKAQAEISNENNNNKKSDDQKADDTLRKQNSGGN